MEIKLLSFKRHEAKYSPLGKGHASYQAAYQPTGKLCPSCGSIISLTTWTQLQQDWGHILNDIFGGRKKCMCIFPILSICCWNISKSSTITCNYNLDSRLSLKKLKEWKWLEFYQFCCQLKTYLLRNGPFLHLILKDVLEP